MAKSADEAIAKEIVVALLSQVTINVGLSTNNAEQLGEAVGKMYAGALKEVVRANT